MVAVWAEADLVVADEFRDGNVPAKQEPLTCAQLAFAALPDTVEGRYFRGDSACHENDLIQWLKDPDRQKEKGGRDWLCHPCGDERRIATGSAKGGRKAMADD
jgi:hypothetical protein